MSRLTYIASDQPLHEICNPHIKIQSIRQALAEGARLPNWMTVEMLEEIDLDEPNTVMNYTEAYTGTEFTISPFVKDCYLDEIYTRKPFCAHLNWVNTEEYAKLLIAYISMCLKETNVIELWDIWLGGAWVEESQEVRPNLKSARTRGAEAQETWDDWKLHRKSITKVNVHQLNRELFNSFFGNHTVQSCMVITK